ncbi:hypothetical protein DFH29DRAFT_979379 [Suillus ampliporus]|nr:hypothetical protein DFH29DRAFT_979379 [Suillus ampliporus]
MDDSTYLWQKRYTFITDLLFGSMRLRFSEAQKKAVLSWAREMGAQNVPTLYALRKAQDHVCSCIRNPTRKVTASSGNIFYINSIGSAIAMDYSNPLTCFCMQDYPEDGRGSMSQVHHGSKMLHELPEELLVLSVCINGSIYFRNELLQSTTGFFIPMCFFQANISSCDAEQASLQVLALGHPVVRTESNGRLVLTVPLIIFMDDVSGNVLKQWNKHHTVYMSNTSMPRKMIKKEFCVRFVSSSPHASPMEIAKAVKESIEAAADEGIVAYNCKYKDEMMLIPYGLFDAGDNPMQAEECSHGSLHCNYFCRTCKVGGTMSVKQSDEGYLKLFEILEQIELSKLSGGTMKVQHAVSSTGTRDTTSASIVNRLLELGKRLNIHQDTLTEILHTILLGIVKYFWVQTIWILNKTHLVKIFQTRLDNINKDGLNSPTLGTDLAQIMPFLIYDLVPSTVLNGWTVIGQLVVLLWHTRIDDVEEYLVWATYLSSSTSWVFPQCTRIIQVMSSVIAVNGDKVTIEKYAILHGNGQLPAEMSIGKIVEIIVSKSSPHVASHVVVRPLHFLPDIHPQL